VVRLNGHSGQIYQIRAYFHVDILGQEYLVILIGLRERVYEREREEAARQESDVSI
jgi:hypothetical protein